MKREVRKKEQKQKDERRKKVIPEAQNQKENEMAYEWPCPTLKINEENKGNNTKRKYHAKSWNTLIIDKSLYLTTNINNQLNAESRTTIIFLWSKIFKWLIYIFFSCNITIHILPSGTV